MAGYTPIFDSVFQGSLCGKYPDLPVWLVLLALQQRGGIIDAHPSYISTVSGIPQADIESAIERFCQPDPHSRTPDHDGQRLEPLPGKGFGWRVINHEKYREKARLIAKNEKEVENGSNRDRMQHRRRPPETAGDRLTPPETDPSEAEAKTYKNPPTPRKRGGNAKVGLPEDFTLTESLTAYVLKTIPDADPVRLFETFVGQAKAKGWQYVDWSQAFQTYVRNVVPNSGHWSSGQYPRKSNGIDPREWR